MSFLHAFKENDQLKSRGKHSSLDPHDQSGSNEEILTCEICKRKTLEINRFGAFKLLEREKNKQTNDRYVLSCDYYLKSGA